MNTESLTTYLNDHLAGSVGAIELVDHLIEVWDGTSLEVDLSALRTEIEVDQGVLKQLLERFDTQESVIKKAGAWIAEKVMRGKMRAADTMDGDLGMLEAFEVLALGIQGKLALWGTLATLEETEPSLGLDLADLKARAQDQFAKVESLRIQAVKRAFS